MPQASAQDFLDRLAKGKTVPAVLLLGPDLYLRDLCRDAILERFVGEGTRDWAISRYSAGEGGLHAALGQAQTLPMLAPRQVVFVEEFDALEQLGDAAREEALARLAAYLDDPAPFTILVLQAESLDQRMKPAKLLSEKALVVSVSLGEDAEKSRQLAAPITLRIAKEMGAEIDRAAAEELVDILNADLMHIRTELQKLVTFAGERKRITVQDVETLVVGEKKETVWNLAEILADRNPEKALEFLDGVLRQGEEPAGMIGAIAWMYRKLLEAQELAPGVPGWQAARALGMRPDSAEKAVFHARKITKAQLLDGLRALYEADSRVKSGNTNPRAVMEFLVTRLAGKAAVSATTG
jgi:DNA polymerase-3 subunit delta